jgi:prophage regulatory protein
MLFNHGEIVMRILSKREVKELVLYSPQHIARLEKAGLFPKRVQLGPNRVGWVEAEVLDWLKNDLSVAKHLSDTPDLRSWVAGVANPATRRTCSRLDRARSRRIGSFAKM